MVLQPNGLTGGASGAVFGLMAAAAIGLHRRGVNVFQTGIGTVLILNLVITFTIPGISIGGHLGGAIAGAICGFVILAPRHAVLPKLGVVRDADRGRPGRGHGQRGHRRLASRVHLACAVGIAAAGSPTARFDHSTIWPVAPA